MKESNEDDDSWEDTKWDIMYCNNEICDEEFDDSNIDPNSICIQKFDGEKFSCVCDQFKSDLNENWLMF